jgi:hypothetical protein
VLKAVFVSWKIVYWKLFFKIFHVCLPLEILVNEKQFSDIEKFNLVSRKIFSFYFGWNTLSENCKKFKNIMLFVDYIKFNP